MAKSVKQLDESVTDRNRRVYDAERERLRTTPDKEVSLDLQSFGTTNALLKQILAELKIANFHNQIITDENIKENETED